MFSHAEYITGIGTGNSTAIASADESIVVGQGLGLANMVLQTKSQQGFKHFLKI